MTRGHHEIATVEAVGLVAGMGVPLLVRIYGAKLAAIFRKGSKP